MELFDTSIYQKDTKNNKDENHKNKKYDDYPIEYEIVKEYKKAKEIINKLKKETPAPVGVDIETTSLEPHNGRIRLIQLTTKPKFSYIIDLNYIEIEQIKPELKNLFKGKKIAHNAKFEAKWFESYNIEFKKPIFCTQLANQILTNGISKKGNTLEEIVKNYLKYNLPKEKQQSNWEKELSKEQKEYAARDAAVLIELREILIEKLKENKLLYCAKIEMEAIPAFVQMELEGIRFDWEKIKILKEEIKQEKEEAKKEFLKLIKEKKIIDDFTLNYGVNLRSPEQVLPLLQRAIEPIEINTLNKNELKLYIAKSPIIESYLKWKDLEVQERDCEKYLKHRNKKTNRAHSSFKQLGAEAGRISSTNPNVQNLPKSKNFRSTVIPNTGRVLVCSDYSQIELRITAQIASEDRMIKAYKEGKDLHKLTASLLLNIPEEEVNKYQRQLAKASNFGLIYGQGPTGFQRYAKANYGIDLSLTEAKDFIEKFFKSYPKLKGWQKKVEKELKNSAFVTSLSGRQRYLPEEKRKINNGCNTPVQATGADILKKALSNLIEPLQDLPGYAAIINSVHDEILIECDEAIATQVAKILEKEMISAGEEFINQVPIIAESGTGDSWANSKV